MKHVSDPIPLLNDAMPGLPAALQTVIDRGMAKSPSDRYSSMGELAKDIDRIVASPQTPESREVSSVWGSAPSSLAPTPATESARPVSFDALRPPPKPVRPKQDDLPTWKEPLASAKLPAAEASVPPAAPADPEATNALAFRSTTSERRRLEWKPQADTPMPAPQDIAAPPKASTQSTKPTQPAYTQPARTVEKKASGIPILLFIVLLLVISIVYFAIQKGLF
jgi:serine/threonine-protein kinase